MRSNPVMPKFVMSGTSEATIRSFHGRRFGKRMAASWHDAAFCLRDRIAFLLPDVLARLASLFACAGLGSRKRGTTLEAAVLSNIGHPCRTALQLVFKLADVPLSLQRL